MKLRVFADRMSQPSRAVLIFCKLNGIDFEEVRIDISKGDHRSKEYKEINPMGQVPAIVDGNFKLFESHAILRYIAGAFPGVSDHWYPSDVFSRAKINSILDWHHSNLRRGSTALVQSTILGPALGLPLDSQAASEAEKFVLSSLSKIESIWLKDDARFLLGNPQPSIADLSLVCEIMQFEVLPDNDRERILGPFLKIMQWIENVKIATNPYFEEAHNILYRFKAKQRSKQVSLDKLPSKL
ncbi:glutathione S-transferase T1-like [Phalaenopsis equestris]|uniref:glutathione S-transferase T1-like n=1 Tax=Phalaenopsis equestris TaxID=78828 RepID=UPI0009E361D8|nr:glutathione S-transferase T1-like [Phalaenopsis equestris]